MYIHSHTKIWRKYNYSPPFYHWSHSYSFYLLFLTTYSIFPLPLAITFVVYYSLAGRVTQAFIPEGPGALLVLPRLSYSFSLTLITGFYNTERFPKGSPVFQSYCSLLPLYSRNPIFSLCLGLITPASTRTLCFAFWFKGTRSPKWPVDNLKV